MPRIKSKQEGAVEPSERKKFGERLSAAMDRAKMSTTSLANALGVSYEMARRYKNGDAVPEFERRNRMAHLLGVSPLWLETGQLEDGAKGKRARSIRVLTATEAAEFETKAVTGEGALLTSEEGDFAVRLPDDSMQEQLPNVKLPLLAKDDIVIVSTTVTPMPGDLVLIRDKKKTGDAAIRRLTVDAKGRAQFVATDASFPTVDSSHGYEMIGVVIAMQAHRRR